MTKEWKNKLYYGDNLVWLRDHDLFPNESIDLIYLDPPFNSKADYNVIFKEPGGEKKSQAQIQAFDDTWHWEKEAVVNAINELAVKEPDIAEFIGWLGGAGDKKSTSTAAYLSMMAVRLVEMHRILKPTGSLYLHCDPTASHYLKLILDRIFGADNFRNEIIWKRATTVKGNFGQGSRFFDRNTDSLLFYAKSNENVFNPPFGTYTAEYVEKSYRHVEPDTGRHFQLISMTGPGGAAKGNPSYEVMGVTRFWRYSKEKMRELISAGLVVQTSPGAVPRRKQFLDDGKGVPIQSLWDDIPALHSQAQERLGYPTQKPISLLERIIQTSSNEGDLVLDPFCGCGTTIAAAEKLKRRWIGIDVTWLAINLIEDRLKRTFGPEITKTFEVKGHPTDETSAAALANKNKKEFEVWAITLVGASAREFDGGVDGIFGFVEQDKKVRKVVVQIKGGDMLNPGMVRDLIGTVKKEGAAIGLMITLRKPTTGMLEAAAHSEPYKSELWGKCYPSIQIRTVAELLGGRGFELPPTENPFKKAERIKKVEGEQLGLTR
jgi:adenine specific DNA methylase Mod